MVLFVDWKKKWPVFSDSIHRFDFSFAYHLHSRPLTRHGPVCYWVFFLCRVSLASSTYTKLVWSFGTLMQRSISINWVLSLIESNQSYVGVATNFNDRNFIPLPHSCWKGKRSIVVSRFAYDLLSEWIQIPPSSKARIQSPADGRQIEIIQIPSGFDVSVQNRLAKTAWR